MNLVLELISSPWFWADIILSVTGGAIVWWGLSIEKKAEKLLPPADFKPDIFDNIVERQKKEVERGWRILMTGIVVEVFAAFGISVISGLEIADLKVKAAGANFEAKQAEKEAGQANERAAKLSIELEKLRHPRIITTEQRKKFIEILLEAHNIAKTRIEVITGNTDKETEMFAFQVRKVLDEAGYGGIASKYQLPLVQMPDNSIYVTNVLPKIDLPAFEWEGETLLKIPNLSIPPLQVGSNRSFTLTKSITDRNGDFATEEPFTDREPEIIALFYESIPPISAIPSVSVAYSTPNNPTRASFYIYAPTKNTNLILYGVCAAFHEAGVTVGEATMTGFLQPGKVAFFIPGQ